MKERRKEGQLTPEIAVTVDNTARGVEGRPSLLKVVQWKALSMMREMTS